MNDTPERTAPPAAETDHTETQATAPPVSAAELHAEAAPDYPAATPVAVEAPQGADQQAQNGQQDGDPSDDDEDDDDDVNDSAEDDSAEDDANDSAEDDADGSAEDGDDQAQDDDDDEEDEDAAQTNAAPPRATFADLGLSEQIVRAVTDSGYLYPTPIQEQAIPVVLMGRDVLGCAQTGTGKTAGFVLPMLDILTGSRAKARMPRSLILEPTRELALQVAENFVKYGKHLNLTCALLIGGESMNDQRDVLEKGVDVLIATPGRLMDLFDRGRILMADCKLLVIDEADRMLDMGFIPDVERIVAMLPPLRQTLFFSATMAPEIRKLADQFLQNPREIAVSAPASIATTIVAGLVYVGDRDKREALRRLVRREQVQNALIFCNRKVEVDVLYKSLKRHNFSVGALHGDMDQSTRFATLNRFKNNELQLLVCSDVAARGLDIGGLSHVFNFDVPFHPEDYVHRIGRTGRAGREGHAYSIATADDVKSVLAIEKLTGKPIPRIEIDGLDQVSAEELAAAATRPRGRGRGGAARGGRESGSREAVGREAGPRESGGREAGRRDGRGRGRDEGRRCEARAPREATARAPRDDTSRVPRDEVPREARPPREDRPRRDDARRDDRPRRDARSRDDRPVGDQPRDEAPRRDEYPHAAREDQPRASRDDLSRATRDDRPRRDEHRRRDRDDLGPTVQGFGDQVPAFMLIPIPRPRKESAAEIEAEQEQEAA